MPTTQALRSARPAQGAAQMKAKALLQSRNKQKNWKFQYAFWVGGALASILVAMLMLVVNPQRGPFQTPVNDANLIAHVNRNAKTWSAAASSFFEDWTIGDIKNMVGVGVSGASSSMMPCQVTTISGPASFDAREKWPQCFTHPIYSMGNCSGSWAIATASALSNRFCVTDSSKYGDLVLSPQQLLSCDFRNLGCSGGNLDSAWDFIQYEGLVSESCFPYMADSTIDCNLRCKTERPNRVTSRCSASSEESIRREIHLNGPVVAPLFLVDDFLVYRAGVYQELPTSTPLMDSRRNRLVHAVKIIGWGTAAGKKYWIIENSWGQDWGEGGYAKVAAGANGILVDSFVVAGSPASPKSFVVGDDADMEADDDELNFGEPESKKPEQAKGPSIDNADATHEVEDDPDFAD